MRILNNKNASLVLVCDNEKSKTVPDAIIVLIVRAWHGACYCGSVPTCHSGSYSARLARKLFRIIRLHGMALAYFFMSSLSFFCHKKR